MVRVRLEGLPEEVHRIADAMQAAGCVLECSREYPNRGERRRVCRANLICRILNVFLGGIRAYCILNDFRCRHILVLGNFGDSICYFLLDSICSRYLRHVFLLYFKTYFSRISPSR